MTKFVLIVDDVRLITSMLGQLIQSISPNIEIIECNDPTIAIEILATKKLDLLIADYNMPGMDGYHMIREALALGWEGPSIIVTASSNLHLNPDLVKKIYYKPIGSVEIMEMLELIR